MNATQERVVEQIKTYILINDCHKYSPDYEIKQFDVEQTSYGKVMVYAVSGRTGDDGTLAACLCRKHRQIFIGPKGGVKAYGAKRRIYRGWSDVMIFGYRN
jgi:hypothetical protein